MKTAIFTVVYPGVEGYLIDFFHSISRQGNKNFELFIINDSFGNIEEIIPTMSLKVHIKDGSGSPAYLRKFGIKWLKSEGVDIVLFADSDDYFSENRVDVTVNKLKKCKIVFNELILFGENLVEEQPMFEDRFNEGQSISILDIKDYNCLGLSNTGVWLSVISEVVDQIPDDLKAFDWAMYSLVLLKGYEAIYTQECQTYYRQHDSNIAGTTFLSDEQILKGVEIKFKHYSFLKDKDKWYMRKYSSYHHLLKKLKMEAYKETFCDNIRKFSVSKPLWWEYIKDDMEMS